MSQSLRNPIDETLNISDAESLLILTYEFQVEALSRLFSVSKATLAKNTLGKIKPIIIYDGRVTKPVQQYQNLLFTKAVSVRGGIHHSKAWCKLTSNGIELTLGSFNLTENGIYRNREVFRTFTAGDDDHSGSSIIRDFMDLIREHMNDFIQSPGGGHLRLFFERCDQQLANWPKRTLFPKLIASGYAGPSGLEQLVHIWKEKGTGAPAQELLVVSPFFDTSENSDRNLLRRLHAENLVDNNTKITLVSSLNKNGFMPMLRSYSKKWQSNPKNELYLSNHQIDLNEKEWQEIQKSTLDRTNETIRKDNILRRDLHAKILVLGGQKESLAYFGSANFTLNAWSGKNQEIGSLEWINQDASSLSKFVLEGLNAKRCASWDDVAWAASLEQLIVEEEFFEEFGYPHCLRNAVLMKGAGDHIHFKIHIDPADNTSILSYQIYWGKTELTLTAYQSDGFTSQSFSLSDTLQLLLESNLKLIPKSHPQNEFFFPIVFDEALNEKRMQAAFPNSDDWLMNFLSPDQGLPDNGFGIGLEDDELDNLETKVNTLRDLNRSDNRTIAMQRYLTQYLALENEINDQLLRFDEDLQNNLSKKIFFNDADPFSFSVYLRLLENELQKSGNFYAEPLFKLGEVRSLLKKNLRLIKTRSLKNEIEKEISKMDSVLESFKEQYSESSSVSAVLEYLRFLEK